jgi:hypothetical protein
MANSKRFTRIMNQSPSGVPVTQIPHNKYLGVRRCKRTGSKEIRMANLCCGRQRRGVDAGAAGPAKQYGVPSSSNPRTLPLKLAYPAWKNAHYAGLPCLSRQWIGHPPAEPGILPSHPLSPRHRLLLSMPPLLSTSHGVGMCHGTVAITGLCLPDVE